MKNSLVFILLFVFYVESSKNPYNFFPNLPSVSIIVTTLYQLKF